MMNSPFLKGRQSYKNPHKNKTYS